MGQIIEYDLPFGNFIYIYIYIYNIQYIIIEHGPFIDDLPIKLVIFHSYVTLPEGNDYHPEVRL